MKELQDMTTQEIIEGVKNGTIKSESFASNEEYLEWVNEAEKHE